MKSVTIEQAVDRLNDMFKADPSAITNLVKAYSACNEQLAKHPTCQVKFNKDLTYTLRMVGILNGIFGTPAPKKGLDKAIAIEQDGEEIKGFIVIKAKW